MLSIVHSSLTWIRRLPRRLRLSATIMTRHVRYVREIQPELARVSKLAGLPYDETPSKLLLWNTFRSLPRLIRDHEREFAEGLRAYDSEDAFLRVARLEGPTRYDWQGEVEVRFPSVTRRGKMTVSWDGARVTGTLNEVPLGGSPREIHDVEPGSLLGPEAVGEADLMPGLRLEGITGSFEWNGLGTPISFTARRLSVQCNDNNDATPRFHRYTFRGGRFRGWPLSTIRVSRRTRRGYHREERRDSCDSVLFERRGRITQVADDEFEQRNQVLGVTLDGAPLDDAEQHVLWLTISFLAGNRVQPIAIEHFDDAAELISVERLSAVEYGEASSYPPFDFRISERRAGPDVRVLTGGIAGLVAEGVPIAEAIHHLHDANTGYTQVELKNLLFCIHTLFEWWADRWAQREIETEKAHKHLRRALSPDIDRVFAGGDELREAVHRSVRYACNRVGADLQEIFFDSLGVTLGSLDLRALRRRNNLFHNGFLKKKEEQTVHDFYQELFDDTRTLRTLAHIAVLKLAGYSGEVFDYRSYASIDVRSGYP